MGLKEKSKDYYKLVRVKDDKYYSIFINDDSLIEYKLDNWVSAIEWNKKGGYHLVVFNTLKNVKKFLKYFSSFHCHIKYKIFKCKIKDKVKLSDNKQVRLGVIDWYWKCKEFPLSWPEGTVMAEYVKIFGESIKL